MVDWDEYKDGGWRSSFEYADDEEDDRPRFLIVIPPNTQVAAEYQHRGDDYYWEARDSYGSDDGYAATLEVAQAAAEAEARARGWLAEVEDDPPCPTCGGTGWYTHEDDQEPCVVCAGGYAE